MPAHNVMVGAPLDAYSAPMSGYPQTQVTGAVGNALTPGSRIIDGTPLRVVTMVAVAAGGVVALRWAGFKFNITAGV